MKKLKHILRWIYIMWIVKPQHKENLRKRLGILVCEVCGVTSDYAYICESCNRCSDTTCNGGCIFCR